MTTQTTTATPVQGKTINVTVYFRLSGAGQKAALLAGTSAAKEQELAGPVSIDLLPLCTIQNDGSVIANMRKPIEIGPDGRLGVYSWANYSLELDAPPASAESILGQVRDGLAEKIAEVKATYEAEQQRERERNEQVAAERRSKLDAAAAIMAADPEAIPSLPYDIMQLCVPEVIEINRRTILRSDREKAAAEKAAAEKAAAKRTTISAWVAEHGNPSQQERLAAGVLPEAEIIDAMTDRAFARSGEHCDPLYVKITSSEVREAVNDEYDEYNELAVQYRSSEARELDAVQWARLTALRAALPEATVTPMLHEATVDHSDVPWGVVTRYGAMAVITVGAVKLRREFAL